MFDLRSRQPEFNGSLIELHSDGKASSLIKTYVQGEVTFDLSSNGHVKMNQLKLLSGGLEVDSGGVVISAGGLQVHGGVSIMTGGLSLASRSSFSASHLMGNGVSVDQPSITAANNHSNFIGR